MDLANKASISKKIESSDKQDKHKADRLRSERDRNGVVIRKNKVKENLTIKTTSQQGRREAHLAGKLSDSPA